MTRFLDKCIHTILYRCQNWFFDEDVFHFNFSKCLGFFQISKSLNPSNKNYLQNCKQPFLSFDLLFCFTFHNQKQIGTFLHQITQPRNYIFQNFIYAKRCVNVENENVIKVWENKQELAQDLGWEEQCHL